MKLFWSSRSPFVRKVMVAAHELGVADRIETERVVVQAANPNPVVFRVNPVGKIPTLILDDGSVIHDSVVILDYLNETAGGNLIPAKGPERWRVLTLQSLADGLMDADLRWMEERRLEEAARRLPIMAGMQAKIEAALDRMEAEPPEDITVGSIATACALAHLDFRFADVPWRQARPRLAAWFATFAARPSMVATGYVDQF